MPNETDNKQVPLSAMLEERNKRQAAEAELEKLRAEAETRRNQQEPSVDEAIDFDEEELVDNFIDRDKGRNFLKAVKAIGNQVRQVSQFQQRQAMSQAEAALGQIKAKFEVYDDPKLGRFADLALRDRIARATPGEDVEKLVEEVAREVSAQFADEPASSGGAPATPPAVGGGGAVPHLDPEDQPDDPAKDVQMSWVERKLKTLLKG